MKKWIIGGVALVLLAALIVTLVLLLSGVNFDRAERRLRKEGYTVVRYGKGAPEHLQDAADRDVEASLVATGGPNGEKITLIRFKDRGLAKDFERLEKKANEENYFFTVVREGRTVIFGWTNAYEVIE